MNSLLNDPSKNIKSVQIIEESNHHLVPDLVLRSYSIYGDNNENLLTMDFLSQLYDIQSILFQNISLENNDIIMYSPLQYWNNDLNILQNDHHILKTIQSKSPTWLKADSFQSLDNFQLFSGISKSGGLIRSASLLRIVIIYPNLASSSIDGILFNNLITVQNQYPQLNVMFQNDTGDQLIKISKHSCTYLEFIFNYICSIPLIVYCVYKLKDLKLVHSKIGILVAFVAQYILTFLASLSLVSIFYTNIEFLQIPFVMVNFIPLLIACQNCLRLLLSITNNSLDLSFSSRITTAVNHSFTTSTNFNIFSILIILAYSVTTSTSTSSALSSSSSYSCFLIIFIVLNYASTYAFFLATVLVDTSKTELQDLIQLNRNHNNHHSSVTTPDRRINNSLLKLLTLQNTYFNIGLLVFISSIVFNWINGITLAASNNTLLSTLNFFSNKRGFVYELLRLSKNKNELILSVSPLVYLSSLNVLPNINPTNYSYDIFSVLEFLSFLLFTISTLILILRLTINKENQKSKFIKLSDLRLSINASENDTSGCNKQPQFQSKDLVKGHVLDIVKLCASSCPFIVSVGIDHKILVWSPLKNPIPIPTQLPVAGQFLPITHVVMSESGSFITVFSRSGEAKCWSRLSMSWVWSIQLDELSNNIPRESFFRRRTHVSNGRRKLVSRSSRSSSPKTSNIHPIVESSNKLRQPATNRKTPPPPLRNPSKLSSLAQDSTTAVENTESNIVKPIKSSIKKISDSMRSTRSLSLDSNFDQSVNLNKLTYNSDMEFIIVTTDGSIFTVDCTSGAFEKTILSNGPILCAKKLLSPRVNDRIVAVKETGELIVSTVVNNKWKSRIVCIDTSSYNKGKSLITPTILSHTQEFDYSTPSSSKISHLTEATSLTTTINSLVSTPTKKVDFNDDSLYDLKGLVMETVPFVGMIVRAFGNKCQLIDVQTGTVLKDWTIGNFKSNTFRVFHPEPSHCRFCGCASVPSFSVSYTELETNCLILHTFSIDNRAKNNICLRVERDSRETRCLGFANVTEHQHWLSNVESWCSTDLNILMGVRKKDKTNDSNASDGNNADNSELIKSFSTKIIDSNGNNDDDNDDDNDDNDDDDDSAATAVTNIFESSQISLRKRNNKILTSSTLSPADRDAKIADSNRLTKDFTSNTAHRLSDVWEGWTMSADGTVKFYEIPDGSDSGLLVKNLGPVCKFGHKSIVVSFGNIMKVLYLGNDSLIEEGGSNDERLSSASSSTAATSSTLNQNRSSLSFINRRRNLRMKKYDLTHSTNFEDQNDAIEEEEDGK